MNDSTSGPFDVNDEIVDVETGERLGTVGGLVSSLAHLWAEPEPGQTPAADELRLHLLSEHGQLDALGLTDDQAADAHTKHHTDGLPSLHPPARRTWNEDRIVQLVIDRPDDRGLAARWQATYTRVERAHGGMLALRPAPTVPEIDQAIYTWAPVNENAASELAVLAILRERFAAHFAWAPRIAVASVDIVDELAREIVDENTGHDEEGDDSDG